MTIGGVSDLWTVNCPLQSVILNGVDERAYYVGDISSDISLDSTTSLIIEFSFWANTTSGSRMIMYIGDSRIWHYNGGGLRWYVSNNQNSSFFSYTSVLEDSTWYDIVLTFNLSMSHPTITVNGASNYIGSGTNNLTTPTWNDITIGEYGAGGFNFGGEIGKITITYGDHITIYDWSGSDITTRLQDKGGNSFNLNSDGIE